MNKHVSKMLENKRIQIPREFWISTAYFRASTVPEYSIMFAGPTKRKNTLKQPFSNLCIIDVPPRCDDINFSLITCSKLIYLWFINYHNYMHIFVWICRAFSSPCQWVKKRGKFKLSNFFDWIESFLYCLSSSYRSIQNKTSKVLQN